MNRKQIQDGNNNIINGIDLSILSSLDLFETNSGMKFVFPTRDAIQKAGISSYKWKYNDKNMLYFNGEETEIYANEIAARFDISPKQIFMLNKNQAKGIYYTKKYSADLFYKEIYYLPFFDDPNDPKRNISFSEYFKNMRKYSIGFKHIAHGNEFKVPPPWARFEVMAAAFGFKK